MAHRLEPARRARATTSKRHRAQLVLLHVIEPPLAPDGEPEGWEERQRAEAQANFSDLCERHAGAKDALRLLSRGVAATEITRVARAQDADVIVMNTHGQTTWKQLKIGCVAQKVLRLVPCPVLLVPPGVASLVAAPITA